MHEMLAQGDQHFLELLRHHGSMTVQELVQASSLTDTAVRHRLNRLMAQGLVERQEVHRRRGRPNHRYFLTERAHMLLGQNYAELASALWQELRELEDQAVGMTVLRRVADRLAERYRSLGERLDDLYHVLSGRGIDVEIVNDGNLPIVRQHSCPYHKLAQQDRTVCGIEKRVLERTLESKVNLSQCRLDGHPCCEFQVVTTEGQSELDSSHARLNGECETTSEAECIG